MGFFKPYIKSMRPYTFFVTGIAGLLGIIIIGSSVSIFQKAIVLIILFFSYGVNQIINDLLGIKEDRINAPNRPLVSGELNRKKAIILTFTIFVFGAVITFFFNPYALVIYFLAYFFNILYEYFKGIPVFGNFWFGFIIALTPIYGALATSNYTLFQIMDNANLIYIAFLVLLSSSTMCYFTYFKDYQGDKKTNKKTAVVLLTPKYARYLNFLMSLIPFLVLFFIFQFSLWDLRLNNYFLLLILITFILSQYTSFLFYKGKYKERKSLELNFESNVLFQVSLVALLNPLLSLVLFIFSFIVIRAIFYSMYRKRLY